MIAPEHLHRYSLFAGLSNDTLDWMRQHMARELWQAGTTIVEQGEAGGKVYFLEEGNVRVLVDGITIAELHEGEQFGEMYLIDVQARSATVIANSDCSLLSLNNQVFLGLRKRNMEAFTVILMNCARDISRRLRESNRRLSDHLRHDHGMGMD